MEGHLAKKVGQQIFWGTNFVEFYHIWESTRTAEFHHVCSPRLLKNSVWLYFGWEYLKTSESLYMVEFYRICDSKKIHRLKMDVLRFYNWFFIKMTKFWYIWSPKQMWWNFTMFILLYYVFFCNIRTNVPISWSTTSSLWS